MRVFWSSGLVYRLYYPLYVPTIPLYGFMDRRSHCNTDMEAKTQAKKEAKTEAKIEAKKESKTEAKTE